MYEYLNLLTFSKTPAYICQSLLRVRCYASIFDYFVSFRFSAAGKFPWDSQFPVKSPSAAGSPGQISWHCCRTWDSHFGSWWKLPLFNCLYAYLVSGFVEVLMVSALMDLSIFFVSLSACKWSIIRIHWCLATQNRSFINILFFHAHYCLSKCNSSNLPVNEYA